MEISGLKLIAGRDVLRLHGYLFVYGWVDEIIQCSGGGRDCETVGG